MNRAKVALVCCGGKLQIKEDKKCLRGTDVQTGLDNGRFTLLNLTQAKISELSILSHFPAFVHSFHRRYQT